MEWDLQPPGEYFLSLLWLTKLEETKEALFLSLKLKGLFLSGNMCSGFRLPEGGVFKATLTECHVSDVLTTSGKSPSLIRNITVLGKQNEVPAASQGHMSTRQFWNPEHLSEACVLCTMLCSCLLMYQNAQSSCSGKIHFKSETWAFLLFRKVYLFLFWCVGFILIYSTFSYQFRTSCPQGTDLVYL